MNKRLQTALAAAMLTTLSAASHAGSESTLLLAQSNVTGNISQNQSGNTNSQSISIGNTDGPKPKKGKKISSEQNDSETGNSQSANVSGSAKVKQSQDGRGNTQSADVDASGNISQNQSGRNNSQSIVIGSGGGTVSGTPSLTQSQTGANRKQSIKIDGKKVDTKE